MNVDTSSRSILVEPNGKGNIGRGSYRIVLHGAKSKMYQRINYLAATILKKKKMSVPLTLRDFFKKTVKRKDNLAA